MHQKMQTIRASNGSLLPKLQEISKRGKVGGRFFRAVL